MNTKTNRLINPSNTALFLAAFVGLLCITAMQSAKGIEWTLRDVYVHELCKINPVNPVTGESLPDSKLKGAKHCVDLKIQIEVGEEPGDTSNIQLELETENNYVCTIKTYSGQVLTRSDEVYQVKGGNGRHEFDYTWRVPASCIYYFTGKVHNTESKENNNTYRFRFDSTMDICRRYKLVHERPWGPYECK